MKRGTDTAPQVWGCVSGPAGKRETGDDDQSWLWPEAKVQPQCKLVLVMKSRDSTRLWADATPWLFPNCFNFQTALHFVLHFENLFSLTLEISF